MLNSLRFKKSQKTQPIFLHLESTDMKTKFLFIFLILTVAGFANGQTDEWISYSSDEGNFSVSLPNEPTPSTMNGEGQPKDVKTGKPLAKKVRFTYNDVTSKSDQSFYLVGWVDYEAGFNFDAKAELKANRDNFIKELGATIISEKPIKLGASQGIEFVAEKSPNAYIKGRVYIIGRRPYMLVALTLDKENTDVEKFLDSFKMNGKK